MLIDEIAHRNSLKFINPMEKFIFSVGLLLIMQVSDSYLLHISNIIIINLVIKFVLKVSFYEMFKLYRGVFIFVLLTNIAFVMSGINSLFLMIKAFNSLSIVYFLFCSTPMTDVAYIMKKLKIPSIIRELFLLMYRFIFLFIEIKERYAVAQNCRLGYVNMKSAYKSLSLIVSNLFGNIYFYSEKLNISIKSRIGDEFLFLESKYERTSKFIWFYIYLIIIILAVFYDKI